MTRILWHSVAPWNPTGYGGQTANFTTRINALPDIDLAISSGFGLEGSALDWNGIKVYPGDDWNRCAMQWARRHQADLVLTLMDVWPLKRSLWAEVAKFARLGCWVPVDHKPCPTLVREFFDTTGARPIAMSRFGETELRDAGLDPLYVPHGVDTTVFKPNPDAREMLKLDKDAFIVGMVANNQGIAPARKAFSEQFLAFSEFHRQHPDSLLYLHTELTGFRNGLNLLRLLDRFEVPEAAVRVSDQVGMEVGISSQEMAVLYSTFDVLLNCSYGEGFGIPIIEAQACGTPVIVTDWTAMTELAGPGWKVEGRLWDDAKQEAFFMLPDIGQIIDALEDAYKSAAGKRLEAREFALQYDADHVTETYWLPVLEALSKPREVKPLRPKMAASVKSKAKAVA